jgi:hypothetical protein
LYNHLCFSTLPNEYRYKIHKDKFYWEIIKHDNFNPRLIEFITDSSNAQSVEPNKYTEFILSTLKHPDLIWEHAFINQLDDYCRFLLTTIFSLPIGLRSDFLKIAYDSRLNYEIEKNGFKRILNPFYSKIKELLGGFINHFSTTDNEDFYDFFNPSIIDFLINYLNKNPDEKWRIIESSIYIEQFTTRFDRSDSDKILISENELERLYIIIKSKEKIFRSINKSSISLHIIKTYNTYFNIKSIENELMVHFKELTNNLDEINYIQFQHLYDMIEKFWDSKILRTEIVFYWNELILILFSTAWDEDEFKSIHILFKKYNKSFEKFMANESNRENIETIIDEYWDSWLDDFFANDSNLKSIYEESDMQEYIEQVYDEALNFNQKFGLQETYSLSRLNDFDYGEKLVENNEEAEHDDYQADIYKSRASNLDFHRSTESIIDDMFS